MDQELQAFNERQHAVEKSFTEYKKLQQTLEEKQKELSSLISNQAKTAKELQQKYAQGKEDVIARIKSATETNEAYKKHLPHPGSRFMRMFLGSTNSVVLTGSPQRKIKFKQEYEEFKYYYTIVSLVVTVVMLFFVESRVLDTLYQGMLIYFYLVLALRENILIANGSNIKSWWINHHYISIIVAITFLTWPSTPSYMAFRKTFYVYALYASTVQILQNKYQMARLYTLKTLGKASEMDTANTDSAQIIISQSFLFLLPFVFIGHLFQLYNAVKLFRMAINLKGQIFAEWQVITLSALFFTVFYGNFVTTCIVLKRKLNQKMQERQRKASSAN